MKPSLFIITILCLNLSIAADPILITESTISLDFDQFKELYFSFEEGDEIIFNMEMVKGRHIKDIQVVELPTNTLLTEFKSRGLTDKRIKVRNKGVYKFRFYSSSLTRRVCKIKIHRIPANESTIDFDTNWKWKTLRDTTYVSFEEDSLTGYISVQKRKKIKQLIKQDTISVKLFRREEHVPDQSIFSDTYRYSYVNVTLPINEYQPTFNNPYHTKENLAWSYWLGVGQESKEDYDKATNDMNQIIKRTGNLFGYSALAELAVHGVSYFNNLSIGEKVKYDFKAIQNGVPINFLNGTGSSNVGRRTDLLQGGFTIQLFNENEIKEVKVDIEIVVAQIVKEWKDVEYEETIQEPQYTTLQKTRMEVKETKIRIPVE